MHKALFLLFTIFLTNDVEAQQSTHEVHVSNGRLVVAKTDDALTAYCSIALTEEDLKTLKSSPYHTVGGKLVIDLSKECQIERITLKENHPVGRVNLVLEQFASDLFSTLKSRDHVSLFQLNNELGFVNADNCVDNITVAVLLTD